MPLHGSCVALNEDGVLLLGPSGCGKSDLAMRLLVRGWMLVADDQVELAADAAGLHARPPAALRGMLEVRGLGLLQDLPVKAPVQLRLAVDLRDQVARLPEPASFQALGHAIPRLVLNGHEASAPDKLALALAAARGRLSLAAGAFAPGAFAPGASIS